MEEAPKHYSFLISCKLLKGGRNDALYVLLMRDKNANISRILRRLTHREEDRKFQGVTFVGEGKNCENVTERLKTMILR